MIFHLIVLIALMSIFLRYQAHPEERQWPPVDSAEILFGGEYVVLGNDPSLPQSDNTPASNNGAEQQPEPPQAEGLVNSGEPAPPAPVLTSERTSPAKVTPKEPQEQTGPSRKEIEAQQQKAKREQEIAQNTDSKLKNAFGNTGTGRGTGGQPNGNSTTGATSGTPGVDLGGRTLARWDKPRGNATGKITVSVTVNRQGRVVAASYKGGSGAIASSEAARQSCVQAARASQFSVDNNAPASQKGTITYTFN